MRQNAFRTGLWVSSPSQVSHCHDPPPAAPRELPLEAGADRRAPSAWYSNEEQEALFRAPSHYNPLHTFRLPMGGDRHYQQQYGDMYFLRLAKLKPAVEQVATQAWEGISVRRSLGRSIMVDFADRLWSQTDCRRTCATRGPRARRATGRAVLGGRYSLHGLAIEAEYSGRSGKRGGRHHIRLNCRWLTQCQNFTSAPPPRRTYADPSDPSLTQIMLEDESGRVRLAGTFLSSTQLATGAIVAALGTENSNGDFEVIDIKVPDLPPQPQRWERDEAETKQNGKEAAAMEHGKIAFVSGLGITGTSSDTLALELLTDYLLGYTGFSGNEENSPSTNASKITRLVIAGNSLGASVTTEVASAGSDAAAKKKAAPKKYGYDASAYNASPITQLDNFLAEILPSIPVTLMPGDQDPANFSLPQQGIHRAMFPQARAYCAPPPSGDDKPEPGWFDSVTNPWEGDVEGWRVWGCSGQNVDDVLRYLDFAGDDGNANETDDTEARMRIMESMLRWRCGVPTAPDTICQFLYLHPQCIQYVLTLPRVLPIPNKRPLRPRDMPTHLLHRQPTTLQNCRDRR